MNAAIYKQEDETTCLERIEPNGSWMLILVLTFLMKLTVLPQTLIVSKTTISNVKFLAEATFNDFEGNTSSIEGSIKWDSVYTKNSSINIKVNLDSLDTGIGLRNSHMRNKYLETDKYPVAEFTGKIVSAKNISNIESIVKVEGILAIHGMKKEIKTEGRIYNFGKLYKVTTKLDIYLSDFGIDRPTLLFNKVSDKIVLQLTIYFSEI